DQAQRAAGRAHVEPVAVVANGRPDPGRAPLDPDLRMSRAGMAGDVGQRFLDDAIQRGLDLVAKSPRAVVQNPDVDSPSSAQLIRVTLQGGNQTEIVQGRRPQAASDAS